MERKKEKRIANFEGREAESEPMSFPLLSNTLCSSGFIDPDHPKKMEEDIMPAIENVFGKWRST